MELLIKKIYRAFPIKKLHDIGFFQEKNGNPGLTFSIAWNTWLCTLGTLGMSELDTIRSQLHYHFRIYTMFLLYVKGPVEENVVSGNQFLPVPKGEINVPECPTNSVYNRQTKR